MQIRDNRVKNRKIIRDKSLSLFFNDFTFNSLILIFCGELTLDQSVFDCTLNVPSYPILKTFAVASCQRQLDDNN